MELFATCPLCTGECQSAIKNRRGSFIEVEQACTKCSFLRKWSSQPPIRNAPVGNLLLSCGIACNGLSYTKAVRLFKSINIAAISQTTFKRHFSNIIQPIVHCLWIKEQQTILQETKTRSNDLVIFGDFRCDSPGHSAKYGTYTMLDAQSNKLVHFQLVQSNETKSSNAMEKHGFIKCVDFLEKQGFRTKSLITDRHIEIAAHVRKTMPDTEEHYYDVWHVAKSKCMMVV
ncbi:uncharacterized protein LOC108950843 [Ciona intestinalis]